MTPPKCSAWISKGVAEQGVVSVFISMAAVVQPSGLSVTPAVCEPHFLGQRPFPETESQQLSGVITRSKFV